MAVLLIKIETHMNIRSTTRKIRNRICNRGNMADDNSRPSTLPLLTFFCMFTWRSTSHSPLTISEDHVTNNGAHPTVYLSKYPPPLCKISCAAVRVIRSDTLQQRASELGSVWERAIEHKQTSISIIASYNRNYSDYSEDVEPGEGVLD